MNVLVILRRVAQREFDEAADWYESQRPGQGAAFTAAIRKVLVDLKLRPGLHPVVYGNVHEAMVIRYPYAIYYRVAPSQVTVLAIFHTSRDPEEWQNRT